MSCERCINCDEPTGRAGEGEDSIFAGGVGPLCEDCYAGIKGAMENHSADASKMVEVPQSEEEEIDHCVICDAELDHAYECDVCAGFFCHHHIICLDDRRICASCAGNRIETLEVENARMKEFDDFHLPSEKPLEGKLIIGYPKEDLPFVQEFILWGVEGEIEFGCWAIGEDCYRDSEMLGWRYCQETPEIEVKP